MKSDEQKQFIQMQEDIKHLKDDMTEVKSGIKDLSAKMEEGFYNLNNRNSEEIVKLTREFEKKYAGKWVEKILWGAGGIIGTTILLAIIELVIKK